MLYGLALLAGVVAGSRIFTAPAAVSWAARLGYLNLNGSWLAFMGYAWTPWIFTLLAVVEMVTDQLPSTPSRKVPMQFGARIVSGALSGATIGASAGSWIGGLIAGVDRRRDRNLRRRRDSRSHGRGLRARYASRIHRGRGRDYPWTDRRLGAAMNRRFDAIVIGAGQAGPPMVGRLAAAGQKVALDRTQADRRNLRQHRLHADQDLGRKRLCGPSREARGGFRREGRAGRH